MAPAHLRPIPSQEDKIELEARLRALEREAAARSEKTAARVVELEAMLASEKEQTEAAGADRRRLTLELEKVERTLSENQPRLAAAEAQQEEFTQLKATATQRERELANAQKEQATLESRLAAKETALAQVCGPFF